jgi:hypothetical protein
MSFARGRDDDKYPPHDLVKSGSFGGYGRAAFFFVYSKVKKQ